MDVKNKQFEKPEFWLTRLLNGKNSLMFIVVIATFVLLVYSSFVYIVATRRVMERQTAALAVTSLTATLASAYPSAQANLSGDIDNLDFESDICPDAPAEIASLSTVAFVVDNTTNQVIEPDNLPRDLAGTIEHSIRSNAYASEKELNTGQTARIYNLYDRNKLWVAAVTELNGTNYSYGVLQDISSYISGAKNIEHALVGTLALAYVVFLILLILVLQFLTSPLRKLTVAVEHFARGDLSYKVKIPTSFSEIKILVDSFNHMGTKLNAQHESLAAYSHQLEEANKKANHAVDKLSQRHREQKAMIETSLQANKMTDPEGIIDLILKRMLDDIGLERIVLYDQDVNGDFNPVEYPSIPPPDAYASDELILSTVRRCHETLDMQRIIIPARATDFAGDDAVPNPVNDIMSVQEVLCLPIAMSIDKVGVIVMIASPGNVFDTDIERFIRHFVYNMEVVLNNKALYRETMRRSHELERINQISRAISSELDMDRLLRDVVEHTRNTIHAECAFVGIVEAGRMKIRQITPCFSGADEQDIDPDISGLLSFLMQRKRAVLVNDLINNPEYKSDKLCACGLYRSFVGAPIIQKDNVVGVICGFSAKPSAFNLNDSYFLGLLASQVAIALDNANLFQQILVRDKRRDYQLKMAQKFQEDRTPTFFKQNVAAVSCKLRAADELAGDFCDVFSLGRHSIAIVIGDVANKGVAASLMTFSLLSMFRNVAKTLKPPCEILESINRSLIAQVKEEAWFATAFYAKLNTTLGTLTYASAGHEQPIWYHADTGTVEQLDITGYPLGLFRSFPYETKEIALKQGDRIVFYTDGVTDATNNQRRRFGHQALLDLVAHSGRMACEELKNCIINKVTAFTGGRAQRDDIIVAVLELQADPWITRSVVFRETGSIIAEILEAIAPYNLDMQTTYVIRLAIDEALANAWRHGLNQMDDIPFDVSYNISDEGFRLRVRDTGSGFDHESLPDPTVEENLLKSHGRGVFLIRQLMDEVEFNDNGNEITVFKRFAPLKEDEDDCYDNLLLDNILEAKNQKESLENAKHAGSAQKSTPESVPSENTLISKS